MEIKASSGGAPSSAAAPTLSHMLSQKGKTCTPRGGKPSHPSAPTFLVNCKKCHAAKCFSHILGGLAHASEALLANAADSESTAWHKLHQEARERKEHPVTSLPLVHGLNALDRRVFFGRHFLSTTPLQSDMQLGFYDISTQYTTSVSPFAHMKIIPHKQDISLLRSHIPMRRPHPLMRHDPLHRPHYRGLVQPPPWRRTQNQLLVRIDQHADNRLRVLVQVCKGPSEQGVPRTKGVTTTTNTFPERGPD